MSIDSLGYVDYFNATANNPYGNNRAVDTNQASVFGNEYPRPKNPGLIVPKNNNSTAKTAATVVGTLGTLALAIMFRGKIKGGAAKVINAIKQYVPKSVKGVVKKGINFIKPATDTVLKYVRKGIKVVDPFLNSVKNFVSTKVIKPVVNLFKKAPAVAAAAPKP